MSLPAGRPVALIGFMGAGKTTVGGLLADRLGRPFADVDDAIVARAGRSIPELFEAEGEEGFRRREEEAVLALLARDDAPVVARSAAAPSRARGSSRRCATRRRRSGSRSMWRRRAPASARHPRTPVRSRPTRPASGSASRPGRRSTRASPTSRSTPPRRPPPSSRRACAPPGRARRCLAAVPALLGERRGVLVADPAVLERVPGAFLARLPLAGGEDAKTPGALERLWRALAALDLERRDVVVAAGGGTVTDAAGFAAATLRRGLAWIAVPTTLVGQVDAAIGGKTAINVAAKNDVGAFHLPEDVVADPEVLATLPAAEWAGGFAEALKTGLLRGGALHELAVGWPAGQGDAASRAALVRLCASVKTRVIVEDPTERGVRATLNLGHTIGHGIEAAAGYGGLSHGACVAIGLVQALRLSEELRGLDPALRPAVEAALARQCLPLVADGIDPERVWDAMRGDKKRVGGRQRLVLLEAVGRPVWGVEVPDALLRDAVARACGG